MSLPIYNLDTDLELIHNILIPVLQEGLGQGPYNYSVSDLSSASLYASLFSPTELDVSILAVSQISLQFRFLFLPPVEPLKSLIFSSTGRRLLC